jgi:hypothetical protein
MTEDEARTKWCPQARAWEAGAAVNRSPTTQRVEPETRCIASDCMMWRWGRHTTGDDAGDGYCGVAGSRRGP